MRLSQFAGFSALLITAYACGSGGPGVAPTLQVQSDTTGPAFQSGSKGNALPFSDVTGNAASPSSDNTGAFSPISANPGVFAPPGGGSAECVAVCNRLVSFRCGDAGATSGTTADCQASCAALSSAMAATCVPALDALLTCLDNYCRNPTAAIDQAQPGQVQTPCHDETHAVQDSCSGASTSSGGTGGSTGAGGDVGVGGSTGAGATPTTGTYTCADLQSCCATTSATFKTSCDQIYTTAQPGGDTQCSLALSPIKQYYCP
jgi:hypothetical protein